jgi:S1-C subfamily serine protease
VKAPAPLPAKVAAPRPAAPVGHPAPVSGLTVQPVTESPVTPQASTATPGQVAALVEPGVVDVDATFGNGSGYAEGTGMVLSSSGLVLTNNHVVEGATSFIVTEVTSTQRYAAAVVSTDVGGDMALVQMIGASGLATVSLGDSAAVVPGQPVVSIGNAEGAGGLPAVAAGTVEATDVQLVASDASTGTSETLSGMISTNAESVPGDSGGPLANDAGQVIGMVTAGAAGNGPGAIANLSFAIPIDTAHSLVDQVDPSGVVLQGIEPGALGVKVVAGAANAAGGPGAVVTAVLPGSPAPAAGLAAGDTIDAVQSAPVATPAGLQSVLAQYRAGDQVSVGWTDQNGVVHTAEVVLIAAQPAA